MSVTYLHRKWVTVTYIFHSWTLVAFVYHLYFNYQCRGIYMFYLLPQNNEVPVKIRLIQ